MKKGTRKPDICLLLNSRTLEELKSELNRYGEYCQAIEWRADQSAGLELYSEAELIQILKLVKTMCKKKTFIFSYSGEGEVGNKILRSAMNVADYVEIDVHNSELKTLLKEARRKRTKTLLSYCEMEHILSKEEVAEALIRMEAYGADLLAVSGFADKEADAYALLEGAFAYNQLKKHKPFVVVAMGEEGQASRICCGDFGSTMTYACGSRVTAPGQFNAEDLNRYMEIYYKQEETDGKHHKNRKFNIQLPR